MQQMFSKEHIDILKHSCSAQDDQPNTDKRIEAPVICNDLCFDQIFDYEVFLESLDCNDFFEDLQYHPSTLDI